MATGVKDTQGLELTNQDYIAFKISKYRLEGRVFNETDDPTDVCSIN